jgi:hypothetical protein
LELAVVAISGDFAGDRLVAACVFVEDPDTHPPRVPRLSRHAAPFRDTIALRLLLPFVWSLLYCLSKNGPRLSKSTRNSLNLKSLDPTVLSRDSSNVYGKSSKSMLSMQRLISVKNQKSWRKSDKIKTT